MGPKDKIGSASMDDLRKAIRDVKTEHFHLKDDNAFVVWFAEAYVVGERAKAFEGVTGSPGDQKVDAVYIDGGNRIVQLVQGKYHQSDANDDAELLAFAEIARDFWDRKSDKKWEQAGSGAKKKLLEAHAALHGKAKGGYKLQMYFATSGRVSIKRQRKAKQIAAAAGNTELEVLDKKAILRILSAWLGGWAPPLPAMNLGIDGPHTLMHEDGHEGLKAWVFSTTSQEVCRLYRIAGERLFARNVRGYLGGDTSINREIRGTAKKNPGRFWFLNNGITIVADGAKKSDSGKRAWMEMRNPQVVNGQQTIRTLAASNAKGCQVLVRVVVLGEQQTAEEGVVGLVGEVVRATNRQNSIKQADLMANDPEQVRIERELRKLNYAYERKREAGKEFTAKVGPKYRKVKREDLANAVSATQIGPQMVRRTEQWEERHYHRIFTKKRPMSDYLTRWWASQQVYSAGGMPIEARWVVLSTLWDWHDVPLRDLMNRDACRWDFINCCQRVPGRALRQLRTAAKLIFVAAKSVYVKERQKAKAKFKSAGRPFKVLTPDAFFRRQDVKLMVMSAARHNQNRRKKITNLVKSFDRLLAT